jgi:hypothetical protein
MKLSLPLEINTARLTQEFSLNKKNSDITNTPRGTDSRHLSIFT